MPPIDGLQLICPSVSMLCVSSSVAAPMRAAASANLGAGMAAADDDRRTLPGNNIGCLNFRAGRHCRGGLLEVVGKTGGVGYRPA